jgi:hypothetical protein|tara:strand:+ start:329 stop:1243 length:915 start_codon:yes stop_codon:yes gene_type:complete
MRQKYIFAVFALLVIFKGECFSEPVGLDGLKVGFERKVGEVLEPLVERHSKELLNLEQALTRAQKLEEALKVREERVRIVLVKGSAVITGLPESPQQLTILNSRFRRQALSLMRPWELKYEKVLGDLLGQLQRAAKLEEALLAKKELEAFRAKIKLRDDAQRGNAAEGGNDFALASAGATAKAPNRAGDLIDGKIEHKGTATGGIGYAWGGCPSDFIVAFPSSKNIRKVRFLLYDKDKRRSYNYQLFILAHGSDDWEMIADRSKKPSQGWQDHKFNPRMISKIKVVGLKNSSNKNFHIVEIEAR